MDKSRAGVAETLPGVKKCPRRHFHVPFELFWKLYFIAFRNLCFKQYCVTLKDFLPLSKASWKFLVTTFSPNEGKKKWEREREIAREMKMCFHQLTGACSTQKLVKIHNTWPLLQSRGLWPWACKLGGTVKQSGGYSFSIKEKTKNKIPACQTRCTTLQFLGKEQKKIWPKN